MAFKYDDEYLMGGEGTLKEYFTRLDTDEPDSLRDKTVELMGEDWLSSLDERDDNVDRLCLQLFSEYSGVSPDEHIKVIWPENPRTLRYWRKHKGLVLVGWQPDDPIFALYRDGEPISSFYASYRGCYQAGGYVAKTDKYYFAHDAFKEDYAGPQNVWQDHRSVCGEVASSFLLGERTY